MIKAQFAPQYTRNEQGLVLFPRDDKYRKELFPFLNLSAHPAKANIYMTLALVEYVSEPGETIMDIFGGTGTTMLAALHGRKVVLIELEEMYQGIIQQGIEVLNLQDNVTLIPGNTVTLLPMYICDHIITSPPYSSIMRKKSTAIDTFTRESVGDIDLEGITTYSKSPENIGNLNDFLYNEKMEKVYKKCYESLPPGGTISIIIKDHIQDGKRVGLSMRAKKSCEMAGFEMAAWHRWLPPGSAYLSIKRARGEPVVDEEDLIVMRRPL